MDIWDLKNHNASGSVFCQSLSVMIELRDVLLLGVGLAGWALAAYQYWRNELTTRPLVVFHHGAFKSGSSSITGTLIVRNRSRCDIVVESLRVNKPNGVRLSFQGSRAVNGIAPILKRRARTLQWRLPAYGSGEFPSKSEWFEIDLANDLAAAFVQLELIIVLSRPIMFSNRLC